MFTLERLVAYSTIAANVVVVTGVIFFLLQFSQDQRAGRINTSLAIFESFGASNGADAAEKVLAVVWNYPEVFSDNSSLSQSQRVKFIMEYSAADPSLTENLSIVDHWMRLAQLCELEERCHKRMNQQLFGEMATGIYCNFGAVFSKWGKERSISGFGSYIQHYSETNTC